MTEELVPVTVPVERSRVPDFYANFAAWSRGDDAPARLAAPVPSPDRLPWGSEPHDADLAASVWDRLNHRAHELLGVFLDHPDAEYTGEELAEMFDIPNGAYGVAGVLAWPGRFSRAVRRQLPLKCDNEGVYRMTPLAVRLFQSAREQADSRQQSMRTPSNRRYAEMRSAR